MSYRSYDYKCSHCGDQRIELVLRTETPQAIDCGSCSASLSMHVQLSAPMVMNHALPDGTKRFAALKESRKLKKLKADLKRSGNRSQEKLVAAEIKKHSLLTKG